MDADLSRMLAERRARERHFPGLPDAAWWMLLDLARANSDEARVSVTSLCLAGFAPSTTGLRHISLLVGEGLVERVPDKSDGRRVFVELTQDGWERISDFFGSSAFRRAA